MATFTIPPLTVAAGERVFGPFAVAGEWSHLELTLDIAALTLMDQLVEFSEDGISWRWLVRETGLGVGINPETGLPITVEHLTADWNPPLPAGQVRMTLNNTVAFATLGGQLLVT